MSSQELLALYRSLEKECPVCRRIVLRYEKRLTMTTEDMSHLEECLISSPI